MKSKGTRRTIGTLAFAALLTTTMGVGARQAGQAPALPPAAPGANRRRRP